MPSSQLVRNGQVQGARSLAKPVDQCCAGAYVNLCDRYKAQLVARSRSAAGEDAAEHADRGLDAPIRAVEFGGQPLAPRYGFRYDGPLRRGARSSASELKEKCSG